jgi:hypothetical protein
MLMRMAEGAKKKKLTLVPWLRQMRGPAASQGRSEGGRG